MADLTYGDQFQQLLDSYYPSPEQQAQGRGLLGQVVAGPARGLVNLAQMVPQTVSAVPGLRGVGEAGTEALESIKPASSGKVVERGLEMFTQAAPLALASVVAPEVTLPLLGTVGAGTVAGVTTGALFTASTYTETRKRLEQVNQQLKASGADPLTDAQTTVIALGAGVTMGVAGHIINKFLGGLGGKAEGEATKEWLLTQVLPKAAQNVLAKAPGATTYVETALGRDIPTFMAQSAATAGLERGVMSDQQIQALKQAGQEPPTALQAAGDIIGPAAIAAIPGAGMRHLTKPLPAPGQATTAAANTATATTTTTLAANTATATTTTTPPPSPAGVAEMNPLIGTGATSTTGTPRQGAAPIVDPLTGAPASSIPSGVPGVARTRIPLSPSVQASATSGPLTLGLGTPQAVPLTGEGSAPEAVPVTTRVGATVPMGAPGAVVDTRLTDMENQRAALQAEEPPPGPPAGPSGTPPSTPPTTPTGPPPAPPEITPAAEAPAAPTAAQPPGTRVTVQNAANPALNGTWEKTAMANPTGGFYDAWANVDTGQLRYGEDFVQGGQPPDFQAPPPQTPPQAPPPDVAPPAGPTPTPPEGPPPPTTPPGPSTSPEAPGTAAALTAPPPAREPGEASPQPGEIRQVAPDALTLAPERFQYKIVHGQKGTTGSLSDVKTFDPQLAGVVQVWQDPADGKTYVVNGHNRVDLARRAGAPGINVQYLDAANAQQARSIGALANIAEGRGTALDAARFFREAQMTPQDLADRGLSLTDKTARDGLALANLSPALFGMVTRGEFPHERAVVIGERLTDPVQQTAVVDLIDQAERRGRRVTNDVVRELAEMVSAAPQQTMQEMTLFGPEERRQSLALEKAGLLAYIRGELARDRNLFSTVGQPRAGAALQRAGNVINVEGSQQVAKEAGELLAIFDHLKNKTGLIADRLNEAARRLGAGDNATTVRQQLLERLRQDLPGALRGGQGPGGGPGAGVPRPDTGAGEPDPFGAQPPPAAGLPGLTRPEAQAPEGPSAISGAAPGEQLGATPATPEPSYEAGTQGPQASLDQLHAAYTRAAEVENHLSRQRARAHDAGDTAQAQALQPQLDAAGAAYERTMQAYETAYEQVHGEPAPGREAPHLGAPSAERVQEVRDFVRGRQEVWPENLMNEFGLRKQAALTLMRQLRQEGVLGEPPRGGPSPVLRDQPPAGRLQVIPQGQAPGPQRDPLSTAPFQVEEARKLFRGQDVTQDEATGTISLRTEGGKRLDIAHVPRVAYTNAEVRLGYGADLPPGTQVAGRIQEIAPGWFRAELGPNGTILTVLHESAHFLEDAGILTRAHVDALNAEARRQGLDANAENRATILAAELDKTLTRATTPLGRAVLAVQRFFDRMARLFGIDPSVGSITRRVQTGDLFKQVLATGSATATPGDQYEVAPGDKRRAPESQVVDGQGNLLPLYHGTGRAFEGFDPASKGSAAGQMYDGFFFAEDAAVASRYAEAEDAPMWEQALTRRRARVAQAEREEAEARQRAVSTLPDDVITYAGKELAWRTGTGFQVVLNLDDAHSHQMGANNFFGDTLGEAKQHALESYNSRVHRYNPQWAESERQQLRALEAKAVTGGNVRPVYLDIRKPFDTTAALGDMGGDAIRELARAIEARGGDAEYALGRLEQAMETKNLMGHDLYSAMARYANDVHGTPIGKAGVTQALQDLGYDGLFHLGERDGKVWVAFQPNQVIPVFQAEPRPPRFAVQGPDGEPAPATGEERRPEEERRAEAPGLFTGMRREKTLAEVKQAYPTHVVEDLGGGKFTLSDPTGSARPRTIDTADVSEASPREFRTFEPKVYAKSLLDYNSIAQLLPEEQAQRLADSVQRAERISMPYLTQESLDLNAHWNTHPDDLRQLQASTLDPSNPRRAGALSETQFRALRDRAMGLWEEMWQAKEQGLFTPDEYNDFIAKWDAQNGQLAFSRMALSGAARTMRAAQEHTPAELLMAATKRFNELGDKLLPQQREALLDRIRQAMGIDDPLARTRALRQMSHDLEGNPTLRQYYLDFFYGSNLSNPISLNRKVWSVWSNIAFHNAIVRPVGGSLDYVVSAMTGKERTMYANEIGPALIKTFTGIPQAATDFWWVWSGDERAKTIPGMHFKRGFEEADVGSVNNSWARSPYPLMQRLAPIVTVASRAFEAAGVAMRHLSFDADMAGLARRAAMQELGQADAAWEAQYVREAHLHPDALSQALQTSKELTFQDKPGWLYNLLIRGRQAPQPFGLLFQMLMPFAGTPDRLLQRGLELLPPFMNPGVISWASKNVEWQGWLPKMSAEAFKNPDVPIILAKSLVGSVMAGIAYGMWQQGMLTGPAPVDAAKRDEFYRQGKLPWSIHLGDRWLSWNDFHPLNMPLGIATAVYEALDQRHERLAHQPELPTNVVYDQIALWSVAAQAMVGHVIEGSYFSGLAQFIAGTQAHASAGDVPRGVMRQLVRMTMPFVGLQQGLIQGVDSTGLVPGTTAGQTVVRNPTSLSEMMADATLLGAYSSAASKPRLDVFGQPQHREFTPFDLTLAPPVRRNLAVDTPLEQTLSRLQYTPGAMARSDALGHRYADDDYRRMATRRGEILTPQLEALVGAASFTRLTPTQQKEAIRKLTSAAGQRARIEVLGRRATAAAAAD